jgi:uncharacterized membrane protein HdeD (DUF308 family)
LLKDFIFNNLFLIGKLIICTGVALCIYAGVTKRENNKKTSNDVMKDNADIRENNITYNKKKINKNTGILMGIGVTAVVVGIILLVLGIVAIIITIYILIHLKGLFDALQ